VEKGPFNVTFRHWRLSESKADKKLGRAFS